jgi:hypothetical protein
MPAKQPRRRVFIARGRRGPEIQFVQEGPAPGFKGTLLVIVGILLILISFLLAVVFLSRPYHLATLGIAGFYPVGGIVVLSAILFLTGVAALVLYLKKFGNF